jgi:hypothetical protein
MALNLGVQPNFTTAAESMRASSRSMFAAANEFEKFGNLPAISQGATILKAIETLTTKIEAIETRLSTKIEAVETKIEAVETRLSTKIETVEARLSVQVQTMSARAQAMYAIDLLHLFNTKMSTYNIYSEHNTTARLQNSFLRLSTAPLMVLHDNGNIPIERFPRTPAEIQQLRG